MWAFSYIILGVIEHLRSVVPLIDDLVGEKASSRVVPAVSILDFLHHFLSLLRIEASQIQVEVEAGVGFLYSCLREVCTGWPSVRVSLTLLCRQEVSRPSSKQ